MNTRQSSNKRYTLTLRYTDRNMPHMYHHSDDRSEIETQGAHWINQFGPAVKTLTVLDRSDGSTSYFNGQGAYMFTAQPAPDDPATHHDQTPCPKPLTDIELGNFPLHIPG